MSLKQYNLDNTINREWFFDIFKSKKDKQKENRQKGLDQFKDFLTLQSIEEAVAVLNNYKEKDIDIKDLGAGSDINPKQFGYYYPYIKNIKSKSMVLTAIENEMILPELEFGNAGEYNEDSQGYIIEVLGGHVDKLKSVNIDKYSKSSLKLKEVGGSKIKDVKFLFLTNEDFGNSWDDDWRITKYLVTTENNKKYIVAQSEGDMRSSLPNDFLSKANASGNVKPLFNIQEVKEIANYGLEILKESIKLLGKYKNLNSLNVDNYISVTELIPFPRLLADFIIHMSNPININQEDIDMIDPTTEVTENENKDQVAENITDEEESTEENKSIAEYVDNLPVEDLIQFEDVDVDNPPLDTAGDIAFETAKDSEWNRVHKDLYNDVRAAVNILSTVLQVLNKYQYQPETITEEDTKKFQTNLEMYNKVFNKEYKISTEDFTESSFQNYVELLNTTLSATSNDLDTIKTKLATAYEGLNKEIESLEFDKYKKYLSELRTIVSDAPVNIVNIVDHMIEATVTAIEEDKTILDNEEGLKSKIYNIVKHHAYLITDNSSASAGDAMNTVNVLTEEDINKLIQTVVDYVKITSNRQCASNCLVDSATEFDVSVYNDKITTAIASSITKVLPKYITLIGDLINNILTKPAITVESDLKTHVLGELNEYLTNFFKSLEAEELKPTSEEGGEYSYTPIWIFHKTGCYGFDGNEKLNKINMENGIIIPTMNFPKFKLISTLLENIDIKKGVLTEYPTSTLKLIESNLLTVKSDERLANVITVLSILTVMGDIYRDVVVNTIFNTQKEIAEISYGYHAMIKAIQEVREGDKTPKPINNTDTEASEGQQETTEEPIEENTTEKQNIVHESLLKDFALLNDAMADIRAIQYHKGSLEDKQDLYRRLVVSVESIKIRHKIDSDIINIEREDADLNLESLASSIQDVMGRLKEGIKSSIENSFSLYTNIFNRITDSVGKNKQMLLELKEKLTLVNNTELNSSITDKFNNTYGSYLDPLGDRIDNLFLRQEESFTLLENVNKDRLDFVKPFQSIVLNSEVEKDCRSGLKSSAQLESVAPISVKVNKDIVRVYINRVSTSSTGSSDIILDKLGIDVVRDGTYYFRDIFSTSYKSTNKLNMSFKKEEAIKLIDKELAILDQASKIMSLGTDAYIKNLKTRIIDVFSSYLRAYTLQWRRMGIMGNFNRYYINLLQSSVMAVDDSIKHGVEFTSAYARAILKMSSK